MKCSLALLGWLVLPALVLAQDSTKRNMHEMHRLHQDLADASADRFFICDTWHHIEGHPRYLALVKQMLKPGGQIVMVDFKKVETPVGPPLEMRIERDDLVKEMEKNGFRVAAEHTFLPYQY